MVEACGSGSACVQCASGQSCVGGRCIVVVVDAGAPPVPLGAPCATATDCQPPLSQFCLPALDAGNATGFNAGYCTAPCGTCPSGICVTEPVPGYSGGTCRESCSAVAPNCRVGYVCQPYTLGRSFCRPSCAMSGLYSACPAGSTCDRASGVCL